MEKNVYELFRNDSLFPEQLRCVKPKINKLYAWGNVNLLGSKSVAIVGSRNSSKYGDFMTRKIIKDLVKYNITIISGMAIGIDAIAHDECLRNGGNTIAILGSGFNKIYPKENAWLLYKIIENNWLILSEYSYNEPVQKKNFPKRNRIISGLSEAVVVIEGSYRSGTSITARNAVIQGKKLFYVPNCVGGKNSYESIKLAKDGAKIATCGSDIYNEIGGEDIDTYELKIKEKNNNLNKAISKLDRESKLVFFCIKKIGSLSCNKISEITKIEIVKVNQILSLLELSDLICSADINNYKIREEFCE